MKLDGTWRASELTNALLASAPDPDLDDSDWKQVEIPGQWASESELQDCEGPVVYRRWFERPEYGDDERVWLRLDGIIGDSEIWLDGNYLGESQEYFKPTQFDITSNLHCDGQPPAEHLLAIEVNNATKPNDRAKRSLTGSLRDSHLSSPGSPAGIWKSVLIEKTGPVAIKHSRLLCTRATPESADLSFRLVLDSTQAGRIRIDTSITSPAGQATGGGTQDFTVASGENQIEWTTIVDNPELWWPAELGEQPLYEVALAIRIAPLEDPAIDELPEHQLDEIFAAADVSDRQQWRTGIRTVEVEKFIWKINGENLFIKGIVLGPTDPQEASGAAAKLAQDVSTTLAAGLNLIRVQGHISYPELYQRADAEGLLIWQDLPLVGGYAASARKPAESMARAAVDVVGHHPSVTVWCVHDEPNGAPLPEPKGELDPLALIGRHLGRHLLPSWSRSILDPLVRRQLRHTDSSRPVITRSGSLPGLADLDHSDPHLWLGWHSGKASDLANVLRKWPRMGSFLGGFGTQSVTVKDWDLQQPNWPGAQQGAFKRYMPRRAYSDGASWAQAGRLYQAQTLRQHIETIRRLKYRPAGGFCLTSLVDAHPSGGFGILDYQRQPKPAFEAVVDSCRPVVIIADRPPSVVVPGEELSLQVHVVNDRRDVLDGVVIRTNVSIGDWTHSKNWKGSIPEDTCAYVGSITFTVPAIYGPLIIDIDLSESSNVATNRYQSAVIPEAESKTGR